MIRCVSPSVMWKDSLSLCTLESKKNDKRKKLQKKEKNKIRRPDIQYYEENLKKKGWDVRQWTISPKDLIIILLLRVVSTVWCTARHDFRVSIENYCFQRKPFYYRKVDRIVYDYTLRGNPVLPPLFSGGKVSPYGNRVLESRDCITSWF